MLTAYSLGASKDSDIYYFVYCVYAIISPMISIGIWKVYMPAYKERLVLDRETDATNITNRLICVFSLLSTFIIIIINIIPDKIICVFAPGLDHESILMGVSLLRIISVLFFS